MWFNGRKSVNIIHCTIKEGKICDYSNERACDKCKLFPNKNSTSKIKLKGPGPCGSVGWVLSCKRKGGEFNSWSGHMPGLQVWSPAGACARCNRSMFLSHINVSLSH